MGRTGDEEEPSIIPLPGSGGPFLTSLEYFYAVRRSHSREIKAEHAEDEEWGTSLWILKQALSSVIIEDYIHGFSRSATWAFIITTSSSTTILTLPELWTGATRRQSQQSVSSSIPSSLHFPDCQPKRTNRLSPFVRNSLSHRGRGRSGRTLAIAMDQKTFRRPRRRRRALS